MHNNSPKQIQAVRLFILHRKKQLVLGHVSAIHSHLVLYNMALLLNTTVSLAWPAGTPKCTHCLAFWLAVLQASIGHLLVLQE
jgi:hypothetical protein